MIQLSYLITEKAMKADAISKNGQYLNTLMSRVKTKKMRVFLVFISFIFIISADGQTEPIKPNCLDSDCDSNLENIFKVRALKVKWESVKYFHEQSKMERTFIHSDEKQWCYYFDLFRDLPPDLEEHKDSLLHALSESIENGKRFTEAMFRYAKEHNCAPYEAHKAIEELYDLEELYGIKTVPVKWMSKEELNNNYIKYLYTPEEVFKEYISLIQHIKYEKETYLRCIDAELAKGNLPGYAGSYSFMNPISSLLPPLASLTKLNFLKIFKEFIFNNNEEFLPDELKADAFLKAISGNRQTNDCNTTSGLAQRRQ